MNNNSQEYLISDTKFEITKLNNGLTLVTGINYKHDEITINISIRTPSVSNMGTSHVVEHCIGSSIFDERIIQQNITTYQEKTTYIFTVLYEDIDLIKEIIAKIFKPCFYKNKNIFLREGIRLEDRNGAIAYRGVVFNEMLDTFSNGRKIIIKKAPQYLYGENVFGNISGGLPECIKKLKFNDIIYYHSKYYIPSNTCVTLFVNNAESKTKIGDFIENLLNNMKNKDKYKFSDYRFKLKQNKLVSLDYENKEDIKGYGIAINKPKNRYEYILLSSFIQYLNNLIINNYDVYINLKNHKKFVNEYIYIRNLYIPCIIVITKNINASLSIAVLKEHYKRFLNKKKSNAKNNFISMGNNLAESMSMYVSEAHFSNLHPLSYLLPTKSVELKDNNYNPILSDYYVEFSFSGNCKRGKNNHDLISNANSIKNYNNNEVKINDKNSYGYDDINKYYKRIKNIKFPLYFNNSFKLVSKFKTNEIDCFSYETSQKYEFINIYFDITDLEQTLLCYLIIWGNYYKRLYQYKFPVFDIFVQSKNNKILLTIRIAFLNNQYYYVKDVIEKLLLNVKINSKHFEFILDNELKLSEKVLCNNLFNFGINKIFSIFDSYYNNIEKTQGYLYYENLENLKMYYNKNGTFSFKNRCTIISHYSKDYVESKNFIKEIIGNSLGFKKNKIQICKKNKGNEVISINHPLNYNFMGFKINNQGINNHIFSIISKIISNEYLIPTIRMKCSAYLSGLFFDRNVFVFGTMLDSNIKETFNIYHNTIYYLQKNFDYIYDRYYLYAYYYLIRLNIPKATELNDIRTIEEMGMHKKYLYPLTDEILYLKNEMFKLYLELFEQIANSTKLVFKSND